MFNNIQQFVDNVNYTDPGNTVKRIIKPKGNVKANEEERKERRLILKEKIHYSKELFPNLQSAIIVPRDHEAHIFKMPNIKGGHAFKPKKKPG